MGGSTVLSLLLIRLWCTKLTMLLYNETTLDSIRTMVKYGDEPLDTGATTLDAKLDRRLHECRGQRNFYITGFALFLIL